MQLRDLTDLRFGRTLRSNALPLEYAAKVFHPLDAGVFEEQIHTPFWELIENAAWVSVRTDMQMALTQRDPGGPDLAFYGPRPQKRH
jgi:hypothetical protein